MKINNLLWQTQYTMADRFALSVQASQDQQNNSVKHRGTVSLLLFTLNCISWLGGILAGEDFYVIVCLN